MSTDLTDRVVVVTGATGAAGPPLVRRLAGAGADVVAVGRDAGRLEPVVHAARTAAPGAKVEGGVVDLLDEPATRRWAARLRSEHGRLDGVVHLVGGWRGGTGLADADLADWDRLHDLLIRTVQHVSRAVHDDLLDSGGRFVLVSSVQAGAPTATNAAYAAAKAAAEAWTLALADSFASRETGAAATVVRVKALLTDAMREAKPQARFAGYTHVEDLAGRILTLWDTPAAELNGQRLCLTT